MRRGHVNVDKYNIYIYIYIYIYYMHIRIFIYTHSVVDHLWMPRGLLDSHSIVAYGGIKGRPPLSTALSWPRSTYMSYSLNSLRGGYLGDYIGDY